MREMTKGLMKGKARFSVAVLLFVAALLTPKSVESAEYYVQLWFVPGKLIEAANDALQAKIHGCKGAMVYWVEPNRDIPAGSVIRSEWLTEHSDFVPEGAWHGSHGIQGCPPFGSIRTKDVAVGHKAKYTLSAGAGVCITIDEFE